MGIINKNPQPSPSKKKMTVEEKAEAFEQWMIKEGLWSYIDGQLTMTGPYVSLKSAQKSFEESLTTPF